MKFTTTPDGTRIVTGTNTYMDGSEYFGPEEFEAERGETFADFMVRIESTPPEGSEPAEFFAAVKGAK